MICGGVRQCVMSPWLSSQFIDGVVRAMKARVGNVGQMSVNNAK